VNYHFDFLMKTACQFGDNILWQDSGIRMPRLFRKDFSKYIRCTVEPEKYNQTTQWLLSKRRLVFMKTDTKAKRFHGIEMSKYEPTGATHHISAGFILARATEVPNLQYGVKKCWERLVRNHDYGTEENPLTLYHWERKDSKSISYDEWLTRLGLR